MSFFKKVPEFITEHFEFFHKDGWKTPGAKIECKEPIMQLVAKLEKALLDSEDDIKNEVIGHSEGLIGKSNKKHEPPEEDKKSERDDSEAIKKLKAALKRKDAEMKLKDTELASKDVEIAFWKAEACSSKAAQEEMIQSEASYLHNEELDEFINLNGEVLTSDEA